MKGLRSKNTAYVLIGLLAVSIVLNVRSLLQTGLAATASEDQKLIGQIETYLDEISSSFTAEISKMAKEHNVPSWGCGPSSYALAEIINRKFFKNKLVLSASYDNDPYNLVERFGFVELKENGKEVIGDHAWLELYIKDKVLFIDPTIAQYGQVIGIIHRVFDVGDSTLKQKLKADYGIIDNRISKLVQKADNNIPTNKEPYPGFGIVPADLAYYHEIVELRNTVNIGYKPVQWKSWIAALTAKYQ